MKHEKYFIYNFKIIHFYKERIFTLNKYLNAKEYDIFSTILHSEEPLNVSQIIELHPEMTANIVQPSIRKLIKLNLVEVADITLDGNIFSRRFKPTVTASDIIQKMFVDDYIHFSKLVSSQSLISAMIQADNNPEQAMQDIREMEQLLREYKENKNTKKK
jgi:hypothetical protein